MPINLLPQDLQKEHTRRDRNRLVIVVSVTLLLLFVGLVGVLFSYRVSLNRQLDGVTLKLNDVNKQVEKYRLVEGVLQAVQLKTRKLNDALILRQPYDRVLTDIQTAAVGKIELIGVSLSDGNQFEMQGKVQSLTNLAEYLRSLEEQGDEYIGLKVKKIAFDSSDFQYSFTITFTYQNADFASER